jgi:hypothetical protein
MYPVPINSQYLHHAEEPIIASDGHDVAGN